ncbi:MAG: DUF885 domain-containing protein [Gemmatimonadota bacterium]
MKAVPRHGSSSDAFETREDVIAHAEAAIDRAERAMPEWFATPGETPIVVEPIARNIESSFPAGFYGPPAGPDDTARYVVNTGRHEERRLLSEAIAFHEAIPGHHTTFAVPAAAGNGPGNFESGFAEGWAVYAETLADEMGLYSSTLDRIGLVAKRLWTTSRLVVEPGIQLHGWSRERAIDFMLEHTALPQSEIELEVDRYVAIPGQSLAYMLGHLDFRRMRREARDRLGERFDIREFHDIVLTPGRRPLPEVAADVERWASIDSS